MDSFYLLVYDFAVRCYGWCIYAASFFNEKAKKWVEGRKNVFEDIEKQLSGLRKTKSCITWVHCSSVGEFEQGRPVIEGIRKQHPDSGIVLTFFSPSGYELRKNYEGADAVFYLPLDSGDHARRLIALLQPRLVIFIKYEFWYHYINVLYRKKIPLILISARFRADQIFFRWYGKFFRNLLSRFTCIFVQEEASLALLNNIGICQVAVAHDTRFDRVIEFSRQDWPIPLVEKFVSSSPVVIGGSTWRADEQILVDFINRCSALGSLKFILVPHEINNTSLNSLAQSLRVPCIFYSRADEENVKNATVLIIDNVGMLASLYQYGKIAFIGGGFNKGVHNILEAAVFGLPVFFGPHYTRFNEANDLVKLGGAFSVSNAREFEKKALHMLNRASDHQRASRICRDYVLSKEGGSKSVMEFIRPMIRTYA